MALRSKNVTNKVNYDAFCERLGTYIMNQFKSGQHIVEITNNPEVDIATEFINDNKPEELIYEEMEIIDQCRY